MRLPSNQLGQGRAVVLLHARPTDRTMWAEHLAILAGAGYHAIALDLPGYGEASVEGDGPVAPWSDVLETLDDLGVDRFALAGNSLGALVSLQVAVTAPERVESLVLIGYRRHDQPASTRLQSAWDAEGTALAAGDLDGAVRAGVEAWTAPTASAAIKENAARMLRGDLELQLRSGEVAQAEDPLADPESLIRLDLPALVGVGELDMPDFFQGGEELTQELDAGELVVIPGAAHLAPLEQPEYFCDLLIKFLATASKEDPR